MTRKRRKSRLSCKGKVRYRDHQEAVRALGRVRARSPRQQVPARAYECPYCKGWHLTKRASA